MSFSIPTRHLAGALASLLLGGMAAAQTCPAADALEPNDDCASAVPASVGLTTGLTRTGPASSLGDNPDVYSITVPAFSEIRIDLLFTDADGDIDLYLWDALAGTCVIPMDQPGYLERGYTGSDNETVTWANNSGAPVDCLIGVDAFGAGFDCNDYDMDIVVTSLLACPGADSFEPNDDCASAVPVTDGSYPFLSRTGPASGLGDSPDFYAITVPAETQIQIDLTFVDAAGDIDLYLWDALAGTCVLPMDQPGYLARGYTSSDNESVTWDNASASPVDYLIGVDAFGAGFDCNDYAMDITFTPIIVTVCPGNDTFEPNDTCATPTPLALGTTPLLAVAAADEDYWSYTMAPDESLTVDVLFTHASGMDIDAAIWTNTACSGTPAAFGSTVTDDENLSLSNTTGAPLDIVLVVTMFGSPNCNDYELSVGSVIDPCNSVAEDAFSPNHTCVEAEMITAGTYLDLTTFKATAEDFFSVDVPDGGTLSVDLAFEADDGDIDCYIYDESTLFSTCGDKSDYLVRGFTTGDSENISWTNSSGSAAIFYVQVNLWDSSSNEDCNTYDMTIGVVEPTMGTPMCAGDGSGAACPCGNESADAESGCLNSTGLGAKITATGSNVVADDDAVFHISQATPGETAVLVQGTTQIAVPFKDGILCMGTFTRRVEFVNLDANGDASTVTSMATNANLFPGQTRWYQWWHRDPAPGSVCGSGSNLSNGLEITWL